MNDTPSKATIVYVGADISKNTIDISYCADTHTKNTKIENTQKAIKEFLKTIQVGKGAVLHFILEATGCYSKTMYKTLRDKQVRFTLTNPCFSHAFARCKGKRDKTDALDAMRLREYGERMTPEATIPYDDFQLELKEHYMLRCALMSEQTKWQQRGEQYPKGELNRQRERMIKATQKEIERIDKKIIKKIRKNDLYKALYEAFIEIDGIGSGAACAVLCLLPEIGTLNADKISALVGVAPILQQSGTSINRTAHITGGRKHIRTALYMPCMTAIRRNATIKSHYQRVKANKGGKQVKGSGKIALIACMRKMLKHMNSTARKVRERMQRPVAAVGFGEAAQASPEGQAVPQRGIQGRERVALSLVKGG